MTEAFEVIAKRTKIRVDGQYAREAVLLHDDQGEGLDEKAFMLDVYDRHALIAGLETYLEAIKPEYDKAPAFIKAAISPIIEANRRLLEAFKAETQYE